MAKPRIFICYASRDADRARALYHFLWAAGADPWLDKEKLVSGDDWPSEIANAVKAADAFVVLLRPGFDDIGFRQNEIRWALEALRYRPPGKGFIIPFVVEPCEIPEWCHDYHVPDGGKRASVRSELLPAIEKHCRARLRPEPPEPFMDRLLRAVTDEQIRFLESLGDRNSPTCPEPIERGIWYSSILLRPTRSRTDTSQGLADVFTPIYFAQFTYDAITAASSWMQTPQLLADPLSIRECCSGIPIRWYDESKAWLTNPTNRALLEVIAEGETKLRAIILNQVRSARFTLENNIIRDTYATDTPRKEWARAVGWMITAEHSESVAMSQEIETEILIPIYGPKVQQTAGVPEILGVANFEWEQRLEPARVRGVANWLADRLQDERQFPISIVTSLILAQVTAGTG